MKKFLAILLFGGAVMCASEIEDPSLKDIISNFEKTSQKDALKVGLSTRQIELSNFAVIIASNSQKLYLERLEKTTLSADEIMEILRQSTAYLGLARVREFVSISVDFFAKKGKKITNFKLNSEEQRLESGKKLQEELFGIATIDSLKGDYDQIGKYLTQNCFGDYYTRTNILSLKERELITFFFLIAQGDTAPQSKAHAQANFKVGNSKEHLIALVNANAFLIGYPRSLNAINVIILASK